MTTAARHEHHEHPRASSALLVGGIACGIAAMVVGSLDGWSLADLRFDVLAVGCVAAISCAAFFARD